MSNSSVTVAAAPKMALGVMLLLISYAALGPMVLDIYLPAMAALAEDFQASNSEAAATLSIFFVFMAICPLVVGPWSDRVGRRLPLLLGLTAAALGTVLCALAPSMPLLLAGRALQAVGCGAVMVVGRAAVRDHLDERGSASFFSTLAAVNALAPILAPSIGALILTVSSWRGVFVFVALVVNSVLLGTIFRFQEKAKPVAAEPVSHENPLRVYKRLLTHKKFIGYLAAAACNGASYFSYLALSPLVLIQIYGINPKTYGLAIGLNGVGLVISAQLNRYFLRSKTPQQILAFASILSLVLIVPLALWAKTEFGGLPMLILLVFLVISSSSFVQSNSMAAAMSIEPRYSGSAAAMFGAVLFGSGTVASFIGGLVMKDTATPMVVIIALSMLGMTLALRCLALKDDTKEAAVSP